jgi:hypothetical protein
MEWTRFVWLRLGVYIGLFRKKYNQSLGSLTQKKKMLEAEEQVGSQKRLCSMEFNIHRAVHRDIFLQ